MLSLSFGEVCAAVLLLAAMLYYWRGRRDRRMLAQIPTPYNRPFIGILPEMLRPYEEFFQTLKKWSEEFGPVMCLSAPGLKTILLSGPDEIQVVLNSQEHLDKGIAYYFIQPWLGTGLLTSPGSKWRSQRKMLNPAFHYKILEEFVPVFTANSAILVDKLREHTQDEYVEINEYVSLCALDIICETAMGTSVNAQQGGGVEYIRAVKRMCEVFIHRRFSPWLHSDFIYELTPTRREEKQLVAILQGFTENVIKQKRLEREKVKPNGQQEKEESEKKLSLLNLLLDISDKEDKLTDKEIRQEIDTFMFAGHDTTSVSISWTLFLLGAHQDIQDKLALELSDIFGRDRRDPTIADLQNMTYLDMVIKESLRLYPSVPAYLRCTNSYLKIGDYTIPPRCDIIISAYNVQRDSSIYPEPDRFDPERFSPEQSAGRHPCAYIPFSAGPRNCIGQKYARLEEKCVLSSILRNFKLETLDYEKVIAIPDVVLKPKVPFKIKISSRV